jgi:cytochrome c oxidase subunit IV
MKKEAKVLNIICVAAVIILVGFAAFNAVTAGSFLSTDNLFLTTVCLMLALVFAVNPFITLYAAGKLPWPFKKADAAGAATSEEGATGSTSVIDDHEDVHFAGTNRLFIFIWLWLILFTLIEIFLGYKPMRVHIMLTILLGLSVIKAALIIGYFMHLKFERLTLILTLVPMTVICIILLFVFFPDSFRSSDLRYKYKEPPPVEKTETPEEP